jgi:hypothetical protein
MFMTLALTLFYAWYVGAKIYQVGGRPLYLLLLLASISGVCHVVSVRRSRRAWSRVAAVPADVVPQAPVRSLAGGPRPA